MKLPEYDSGRIVRSMSQAARVNCKFSSELGASGKTVEMCLVFPNTTGNHFFLPFFTS